MRALLCLVPEGKEKFKVIYSSSASYLAAERQHLLRLADTEEYIALFRLMSPVPTEYWTDPGNPPSLRHRAAFDDLTFNDAMRGKRELAKGRFRNGGVGYVMRSELPLFAAAYAKDADRVSLDEAEMLALLEKEGPLTVGKIKKKTGMLVKYISPLLHKLAERCLAAEDQYRCGWDIKWYTFGALYPEAELSSYTRVSAIKELILRRVYADAYVSEASLRSYYGFGARDIQASLGELSGELLRERTDGGEDVYILPSDADFLREPHDPPRGAWVFGRSDPLVRAAEYRIKGRFVKKGSETMYYIWLDGEFRGAVVGRFRFTPNELHDAVLDMEPEEAEERRSEIIRAVYRVESQTESPLLLYNGDINLE